MIYETINKPMYEKIENINAILMYNTKGIDDMTSYKIAMDKMLNYSTANNVADTLNERAKKNKKIKFSKKF
ncbi:hypothetical protein C0585_03710 [Candidatus Woesearchaeota archaeon]|nr:MAG: hypothetical protein C0585_03710 [Candidatus Woesearchaeota archaeon]